MSTKKSVTNLNIKLGIEGSDYVSTQLLKRHEGKTIFKIEYDISENNKCVNYIDNENKHIVFKNKDEEYVLFHIENKSITEKMKESIGKALTKKLKTQRNQDLIKDVVILQSCLPDIDLSIAQRKLGELNDVFERKCHNLTFKLKHFFDYSEPMVRYNEHGHICIGCKFYDTLILAICKKPEEKCISTIEIMFSPSGEVLINSKTDSEEEGKKYNKILRTVLFIIGDKIDGAKYIKSVALNPVSAWLLLEYSKATIEPGHPFEEFINDKKITRELLKEYYDAKNKPIHLIVPLNKPTADNSTIEFNKTIDEVKCSTE
jgi:hypothetical protein